MEEETRLPLEYVAYYGVHGWGIWIGRPDEDNNYLASIKWLAIISLPEIYYIFCTLLAGPDEVLQIIKCSSRNGHAATMRFQVHRLRLMLIVYVTLDSVLACPKREEATFMWSKYFLLLTWLRHQNMLKLYFQSNDLVKKGVGVGVWPPMPPPLYVQAWLVYQKYTLMP